MCAVGQTTYLPGISASLSISTIRLPGFSSMTCDLIYDRIIYLSISVICKNKMINYPNVHNQPSPTLF